MKETEKAKCLLKDKVTFAAVGKKGIYTSEKRGVKPILDKIDADPGFFDGASVADRVIGKAAAMLLEKYGVAEIYAQVTSEYAAAYLENKSVKLTYEKKTDFIMNRSGTDMCPMEKTVLNTDNADEGEILIRKRIKAISHN